MASTERKCVLWVDDDSFQLALYAEALKDRGIDVQTAIDAQTAINALSATERRIDLAILDVMLPTGGALDELSTRGGFRSGMALARWIREHRPDVSIVGCSRAVDAEVADWFSRNTAGYFSLGDLLPTELADRITGIVFKSRRLPRMFIVHGHDEAAKYALKNYLQNALHLGEAIILHEQPSMGRTIIEKFESEAARADLVFVLLTPDDAPFSQGNDNTTKRRARQNVIFELGYFLGALGRKHGRVLLLHKGGLELPSDISGLIYVDISGGIEAAGEALRRELTEWL
jgi:predicted nucleotide-binding protein